MNDLLTNPDLRLLTLIGPGGIGKTRLALAVGSQMMDFFPDGIFFVPLASVGNPLFVVTEIARLFGLRDDTKDILLEELATVLREQRLLLILDNFEHLISAGPSVAWLLGQTKQLKVLVTSRELLNVSGEQIFVVDTLTLPPPIAVVSELENYEASQLLLLRAQAADVTFRASDENAAQIVTLCHSLEGLPLAIELRQRGLHSCPSASLSCSSAHRRDVYPCLPADRATGMSISRL